MNELARLLVTLALAGTAVTFLGSFILWLTNEERRIGGALKRVLQGPSEATLIARGRGRGAGLSVTTGLFATVWDKGAWCMVYRLEEVTGAELLVDGEVAARVFRGEPRKALDRVPATAREVVLRLVFDDPRYPDFDLELWTLGDETRREAPTAARCAQAANQWLARIESIVRRPRQPAVSAAPPPPPSAPPPKVARPAAPPAGGGFDEAEENDDAPPWDDDDDAAPDLFDGDYEDEDQRN
ncbi:MAG: hypothetical protein GC145_17070 [Caulobacter sp.]|nr:hypothetical protein [Caulobacter sp.]